LYRVFSFIRNENLLADIDHIDIALSGGADSVFLAKALKQYVRQYAPAISLRAHHIRHGLRDSDGVDMEIARDIAKELNIPFICTELHLGDLCFDVEQQARNSRYQALTEALLEIAQPGRCALALAHHGDDNLETAIWRLGRGCGMEGLTLTPRRFSNGIWYLRPLLCLSKMAIYEDLLQSGTLWAEDPTNELDDYKRNRIRHEIAPLILEESSSPKSVYRSLLNLRHDTDALSSFAESFIAAHPVRYGGWFCEFAHWQTLEHQAQAQVLRHVARHLVSGFTPTNETIQRAIDLMHDRQQTRKKTKDGQLYYGWCRAGIMVWPIDYKLQSQTDIALEIPTHQTDIYNFGKISLWPFVCESAPKNTTQLLCFAHKSPQLMVRPASAFKQFQASDGHWVKAGEALRNAGVPDIWHAYWPVLCDDHEPLWILGGMRTQKASIPHKGDNAIAVIWDVNRL
jgi:tRNA(Ile)-lysidine synthetase-like protein